MQTTTALPFTSRTRVALAIARGIAAARGEDDLTATHIAAGIAREGANPALAALWYAGLPEDAIRALAFDLANLLTGFVGRVSPRTVTIDLTPGEEDIIRQAEVEADRLGHPYLGTEHILLAILRSDKVMADHFAKLGITAAKYEVGLTASMRGDAPPDQ